MYLALIWVEVLWSLRLVERDAFQRCAVSPGTSVVVAQDAENSVALQRAVTTHHQPILVWFEVLLQCKDAKDVGAIFQLSPENKG